MKYLYILLAAFFLYNVLAKKLKKAKLIHFLVKQI